MTAVRVCSTLTATVKCHLRSLPRQAIYTTASSLRNRWIHTHHKTVRCSRPHQAPRPTSRVTCQASTLAEAMPKDTSGMSPADKLQALRKLMAEADNGKGVDAYIIPSEDPHMSEYPPECHARRAFISNFTGSAGTAVVTKDAALLWTDGRYWLQAGQQLSEEWTLMKMGHEACPEMGEWLATSLPAGSRVGVDPFLMTVDSARKLQAKLGGVQSSVVPLLSGNLVDSVWAAARPEEPQAPVRVHAQQWAGATVAEKIKSLRATLTNTKANAILATMLDEVAWLFNLRGGDVPYNPVFIAYGIVTTDAATLYINPSKVTEDAKTQLDEAGVTVKAYESMVTDVEVLAQQGSTIMIDPTKVSYALYQAAVDSATRAKASNGTPGDNPRGKRKRAANGAAVANGSDSGAPAVDNPKVFVERPSPIEEAKAIKNAQELSGMREAHLRDGVALCKFFCWLEQQVAAGHTLTEVDVDTQLTGRRAQQEGWVEPSFPTIAGANSNGAIIHYRAEEGTAGTVDGNTLLLVDSGGQYDCGTTDITRTMHFGEPTEHQKLCYTRVLQGHIGLDVAVFPEGTPGIALDVLARRPLWGMGLNYRHGTGHGVGAALNVHEGPQSISTRWYNTTPLKKGMICSNEPGYYEDGAFGIRIENLVVVEEAATEFRFGGQAYYKFARLTMCPMQTKLMDTTVMSDEEIQWVNTYHKEVYDALSGRLADDAETLAWLTQATQPLQK